MHSCIRHVPLLRLSSLVGAARHVSTPPQGAPEGGRGSFFDFFGLEPQLDIDRRALHKKYHVIQARAHPDKQVGFSDADREVNEGDSIFANQAYEVLRDPFLRARYLLRLVDLEEDTKTQRGRPLTPREREEFSVSPPPEDGGDTAGLQPGSARERTHSVKPSPEYMMQMLDLNVALDEIEDPTSPAGEAALKDLLQQLDEMNDHFWERISAAWSAGDREEFRQMVMNWSYVHRLRDRIKEKQ